MGLPVILAALHLFPSSSRERSHDPEKGYNSNRVDEDSPRGVRGTHDDPEDDSSIASNVDRPRRRSRGHKLSRASTTDTTATTATLTSRVKSFLFPQDDPESLEQFVPNYRWTPIISGVVIPFSILLEIPGLTERWYIRTQDGQTVETKRNPAILDIGLAFSLAFGLFANICLVMRFLEKRVRVMTLLSIIFLTLHDVLNIVTIIIFGVEHRFDDGFTYGESFWMTVCSTAASTVTNISLIYDYVKTPDFATSGSGLTRKQRALVIIVIVLLVYVAFGALCNTLIQDLTFIDGLYFTVVTIETIGYGDITPNSTGARIFVCLYMVFGILNIGIAIGMCRETILEGLEVGYRKRVRRMRLRRQEARRFRRWEARWRKAVEWRLKAKGLSVWVPDQHLDNEDVHFVGLEGPQDGAGETHWVKKWFETIGIWKPPLHNHRHTRGHPRGKHLNVDALTPQQLEAAALEAGVPLEMFLISEESYHPAKLHRGGNSSLITRRRSHSPEPDGLEHSRFGTTFGLHRTPSANGWPSHPQTPTHAQVGRMAAMITKFALAVTGTHIRMVGHTSNQGFHPQKHNIPEGEVRQEANGDASTSVSHSKAQSNSEAPVVMNEEHNASLVHITETPLDPSSESVNQREGLRFETPSRHPEVPKWARQLARGEYEKSTFTYEEYRDQMESEEKKAYYVKLMVAWSLFLVFWLIGSAIFHTTEGWSYGVAMYFCFMAFTTCGYGDFAPSSPAGRSVFVVWALLGVGTMTILISVLQEAGSSRYKNALHSRMFDNAVKKYQAKEDKETTRILSNKNAYRTRHSSQPGTPHRLDVSEEAVEAAKQEAQKELEQLPAEIIRQTQNFREHMQFYVNHGQVDSVYDQTLAPEENRPPRYPKELKALLDQIGELEGMSAKAKREIMQDEDARKTLFILSIERTLRGMLNAAESALAALAERDTLVAAQHDIHEHGAE
ncbi:hypothetical protein QCA50_011839 [Cerrena zonata]|uniref:Potassium channel domain-containing protein n=1 Tax=Cerrena zonata TaxID=2478898 RepID=A0AAW0FZY3_9APHY